MKSLMLCIVSILTISLSGADRAQITQAAETHSQELDALQQWLGYLIRREVPRIKSKLRQGRLSPDALAITAAVLYQREQHKICLNKMFNSYTNAQGPSLVIDKIQNTYFYNTSAMKSLVDLFKSMLHKGFNINEGISAGKTTREWLNAISLDYRLDNQLALPCIVPSTKIIAQTTSIYEDVDQIVPVVNYDAA